MAQQETKIYNNEQEVFDDIVAYAKTMSSKSADSRNHCYYRTQSGNKCLVGALITDEEYTADIDILQKYVDVSVSGLRKLGLLPPRLYRFEDILDICQRAHDTCSSGESFKEDLMLGLRRVAEIRNLSFNLS